MVTEHRAETGHSPPYFAGMKVEVGIPFANNRTFRDWAIINEVDDDLVALQLSRDILPEGVSLRVGQILSLHSEYDFQLYDCRAFIVSKGYEQDLLLRITGEIVAHEVREFYRIDAFLPIRFHLLPDQNPAVVKKVWEERRRWRCDEERALEQRRLEAKRERLRAEEWARAQRLPDSGTGVPAEQGPDTRPEESEDNQYYESWRTVTSVAVNISGGGLRVSTGQEFVAHDLMLLEIFVPSSNRIVDVVARVIFSRRNAGEHLVKNFFTSGLQFVHIDESARSAINRHLNGVQLQRIRQFKGFADVEPLSIDTKPVSDRHYAFLETVEATDVEENGRSAVLKRRKQVALALVCAGIVWLLFLYFAGYAAHHPKHVIQEMFETGIRKLKGN